MLKDTIFREYDIRGIVGTEIFIDEIYNLACAIIVYFLKRNPLCKRIVIGMDGRVHSHAIKQEIEQALQDAGMTVTFIGVCASPTLYYAVYTLNVDAGLMITASHNPADYNGLKICLGKSSVWGPEIRYIKELYYAHAKPHQTFDGTSHYYSITPDYIAFLKKMFPSLVGMDIPFVADCGNGSAGTIMPALCEAMEWKRCHLLYPEVDGTYPHHEADPVKKENMMDVYNVLQTTDAQLGIGFDGDADRMGAMTKEGYLVPGDQLLALFAQPVVTHHPGCVVIGDIKSSAAVIQLVKQWGGQLILSPSGHAIIKHSMHTHKALLGGELSCHFFFADRYFGFDDAVYALLRLLELIYKKQSLENLLSCIPPMYSSQEYRFEYDVSSAHSIIQELHILFSLQPDTDIMTIDGIRVHTPYGWGLVRPSNTQPLLCMRFESTTLQGLAQIKKDFLLVVERYINPLDKDRMVHS